MTKRGIRIGRLTRLVCALALILLGFAHTPPHRAAAVPAAEFAAYVLPDGTVPMLCDHAGDPAHGDGHAPAQGGWASCEACRLSGATLLPPPPALTVPSPRLAGTLSPRTVTEAPATAFRLTAAPRGPPLSSHA